MDVKRVLYVGPYSDHSRDFIRTVNRVNNITYNQSTNLEQAVLAIRGRSHYSGVVLGSLNIPEKEGDTKTSGQTGFELIEMAKRMGFPVILLSNGEKQKNTRKASELGARVTPRFGEGAFQQYLITAEEAFNSREN